MYGKQEEIPVAQPVNAQVMPMDTNQMMLSPFHGSTSLYPYQPGGSLWYPASPPSVVPNTIPSDLKIGGYNSIAGKKRFIIKQRFELIEAIAGQLGCGCVEQVNKYDIFDANTGFPVLYVEESSDMFERGCCKPNHTAEIQIFDARYGVPVGQKVATIFKPFRCNCFAVHDICIKRSNLYANNGALISNTCMPRLGGGLTPVLETMTRCGHEMKPQAKIIGPSCIVGGLITECCGEINFRINNSLGQPYGRVAKTKPGELQDVLAQGLTDTDTFFYESALESTDEEVMAMLANVIFLDYLFFENGPPVQYKPDGSVECNLCDFYCFGCLCPCKCSCGGNNR